MKWMETHLYFGKCSVGRWTMRKGPRKRRGGGRCRQRAGSVSRADVPSGPRGWGRQGSGLPVQNWLSGTLNHLPGTAFPKPEGGLYMTRACFMISVFTLNSKFPLWEEVLGFCFHLMVHFPSPSYLLTSPWGFHACGLQYDDEAGVCFQAFFCWAHYAQIKLVREKSQGCFIEHHMQICWLLFCMAI